MDTRIVADSCCDLRALSDTPFSSVPLKVLVEGQTFVDDTSLDVNTLLHAMAAGRHSSSACPAPEEYAVEYRKNESAFAVTLSSALSGSYNSARVAADMVTETQPDKKVHVVDSKGASATEIALVIKLRELMSDAAATFEEIVEKIEAYRDKMITFFVIQRFDNLVKAGRMSKLTGAIAKVLNINPICGDNGAGEIKVYEKTRGERNALQRMVEMVRERTDPTGRTMVITHCNNPEAAAYVKEAARKLYDLKDVFIFPVGGLSAYYADDKGVILSV